MSVFRSSDGNEWRIFLDAFLLADVQKETGIDLADVSAGGWMKVETDAGAVGRVLAVLCREEATARKIDSRSFVRTIRREVIDLARAALIAEGADFFPLSDWSAILSNLGQRKIARDQMDALQQAGDMREIMPLMEAFLRLPEDVQREIISDEKKKKAKEDSDSQNGPEPSGDSATGLDATPLPPATDLPEHVA